MMTFRYLLCIVVIIVLSGCEERTQAESYDRTAFLTARPMTLLLMPPTSKAVNVNAVAAVWAQAARPLAEAGYYVLPITLVDETFRQNGISSGDEAAEVPFEKLRSVFGADAAVYIEVSEYTETEVEIAARIVDLRSGDLLWQGETRASATEYIILRGRGGIGDVLVLLAGLFISHAVDTLTDKAYDVAGVADQQLFTVHGNHGLVPGPHVRTRDEKQAE